MVVCFTLEVLIHQKKLIMPIKRRDFVKLLPFGVVLPAQMFSSFSSMASASNSDNQKLSGDINSSFLQTGIDEIYNKAIVIDGLIIGR
ncbi:MAG: hypothetical protein ACI905_002119, partial [Roseivirga sp.]